MHLARKDTLKKENKHNDLKILWETVISKDGHKVISQIRYSEM